MANIIANFQDRVRISTNSLALILAKTFSCFMVGLTIALVGDQVIDYGWFSFVLVVTAVSGTLFKIMRGWTWMNLGIFDLICILIGLLVRMYILLAPG